MSEEWIEKAAIECASRVLIGDGEKQFARVIRKHFENAGPPRPWLKAEEVREPGWYWHKAPGLKTHAWRVALHDLRGLLVRHGDYFYPIGTCPHVEGCRCSSGLWQRIPEPELTEEEA